jgi:hypothetical protein
MWLNNTLMGIRSKSADPFIVSDSCDYPCGHFDLSGLVVRLILVAKIAPSRARTQRSEQISHEMSNFHPHLVFISVATSGKIYSQHGKE